MKNKIKILVKLNEVTARVTDKKNIPKPHR